MFLNHVLVCPLVLRSLDITNNGCNWVAIFHNCHALTHTSSVRIIYFPLKCTILQHKKYFITGVWLRKLALTVAGVTSNNHFYFFLHFTIWILPWWLMNRHLKPKRSTANPEHRANEINKDLYRGRLWQQEWKEGNSMMSPSTSMFHGLCSNAAVFQCACNG